MQSSSSGEFQEGSITVHYTNPKSLLSAPNKSEECRYFPVRFPSLQPSVLHTGGSDEFRYVPSWPLLPCRQSLLLPLPSFSTQRLAGWPKSAGGAGQQSELMQRTWGRTAVCYRLQTQYYRPPPAARRPPSTVRCPPPAARLPPPSAVHRPPPTPRCAAALPHS